MNMDTVRASIDPRLQAEISRVGDSGDVEAIVMMSGVSAEARDDARGPGGKVLDRLTDRLHEQPDRLRYMPRLGAVYVRGSGRFVGELLKESEVVSATAVSNGNDAKAENELDKDWQGKSFLPFSKKTV